MRFLLYARPFFIKLLKSSLQSSGGKFGLNQAVACQLAPDTPPVISMWGMSHMKVKLFGFYAFFQQVHARVRVHPLLDAVQPASAIVYLLLCLP